MVTGHMPPVRPSTQLLQERHLSSYHPTAWLTARPEVSTAGKTGTAEYCDNIAIKRRWCKEGQILPTHSWYVGYAPYENPEIVVAAFIFNGGEGSQWAAPVVRDVMAAYFGVDQYAPPDESELPDPGDGQIQDDGIDIIPEIGSESTPDEQSDNSP